ncbi:hypothetical protein KA012_02350 [Candidatus Woesebacteria bacterium]|nr:hypothetical protein [Candidatus Woesebacteria bacterium]
MPARAVPEQFLLQDQKLAQVLYGPLYRSLAPELQEQVRVAISLYTRERRQGLHFSDYSFIVFPMAKAYEGFLKQYLFQMELLSVEGYHDKRFRIGRALNPDLRHKQRDEHWLYDDIVALCSEDLGRQLWETWLQCRNRVFHYFPASTQSLSLNRAGEYLMIMVDAMTAARSCQKSSHRDDQAVSS